MTFSFGKHRQKITFEDIKRVAKEYGVSFQEEEFLEMFRYADKNGKSNRNIGTKKHENVFTLNGNLVSLSRIRTLT